MPEEKDKLENQDIENQAVENKDVKDTEEKPNMNEDGTPAGPSPGFLEGLKEKFWHKKEKVEELDESKTDIEVETKDTKTDEDVVESERIIENKVSDDFVEAARLAGWSDNQITEFAEGYTNEELDSMISSLGKAEDKTKDNTTEKEKQVTDALNISDDVWNELKETNPTLVEKILRPLITENKTLKESMDGLKQSLSAVQKSGVQKEVVGMEDVANGEFDEVSKEFPVFGKTEELARFPDGRIVPQGAAFEARNEVWQMALRLFKTGNKNYTFRNALKDSMNFYKGRNLKESVRQEVVKDIKKKSENLTPKKSRKNVVKTYESDEERKADVVRKAAEQAGVTFND